MTKEPKLTKEEESKPSFIGEKEVASITRDKDDVKVEFVEYPEMIMTYELFVEIISHEKGTGSPHDLFSHMYTQKFMHELSEAHADVYLVQRVADGIRILLDNIKKQAISSKFNAKDPDDIKLADLFQALAPEIEKEVK